jgi:uncharacterized LabA/DUF88 family protein
MIKHTDQRVGIFIDTQNLYHTARHLFRKRVNFKNVLEDAVAGRKLIRAIAYVISTKTEEEAPFFESLEKLGIELQNKELIEYASGAKKADWDVGLAIDVVRMIDMLDVIIILSGDGDFTPLVEYVQNKGRRVEVMSFKETTNAKLKEIVDDFIDLSSNKRRYLISSAVVRTRRVTKRPRHTTKRTQKRTTKN